MKNVDSISSDIIPDFIRRYAPQFNANKLKKLLR